MPGASNLAIMVFFRYALSISGILKVVAHNFMKMTSRDDVAAKGLLWVVCGLYTEIWSYAIDWCLET